MLYIDLSLAALCVVVISIAIYLLVKKPKPPYDVDIDKKRLLKDLQNLQLIGNTYTSVSFIRSLKYFDCIIKVQGAKIKTYYEDQPYSYEHLNDLCCIQADVDFKIIIYDANSIQFEVYEVINFLFDNKYFNDDGSMINGLYMKSGEDVFVVKSNDPFIYNIYTLRFGKLIEISTDKTTSVNVHQNCYFRAHKSNYNQYLYAIQT